jgi:hypothetical protein
MIHPIDPASRRARPRDPSTLAQSPWPLIELVQTPFKIRHKGYMSIVRTLRLVRPIDLLPTLISVFYAIAVGRACHQT